jgi:hypothetical protein
MALIGLGVRRKLDHAKAPAATAAATATAKPTLPPGATYESALAEVKKKRKLAEIMADASPGSWSRRAVVASLQMGYAQLSGDYEGYYAADRSLAEAVEGARGRRRRQRRAAAPQGAAELRAASTAAGAGRAARAGEAG